MSAINWNHCPPSPESANRGRAAGNASRRAAHGHHNRRAQYVPLPGATWTLAWFFGGGARCSWGFNHWQPILAYGTDPRHRLKMIHTDVIRSNSQVLEDRTAHPCPKPLSFVRKLINRVAPSPTDVILDPFMGSGTTGVAAIQLGHRFVGIEMNGDYMAIAKRRIAQARPDFTQTIELIIEKGTIRHVAPE